ncbi:MAG TPA: hypothetical protein VKB69_13800, partial [Micromonosporaceae bacterium]|nr:hypothetical protein [Micromonosporaceae bacterium]
MILVRWTELTGAEPDRDDIALLRPDEVARLGRYVRRSDAARVAAGWALVRRLLGDLTGTDPAAVHVDRRCDLCGHPAHGKPRVAGTGLDFSLSYGRDRAAVAVTDSGRIGFDVERDDCR